ncbi:MAG: hypothetical protein MUC69_03400 [Gemmatimonadales bacterium]|nr:hypothetical protein [Gemmatimonadales bacterium]
MRGAAAWPLLGLLAAACARGDAPGPAALATSTVRDSAGVRLVASSAPAWGERGGWRVEARPQFEVGGVAGDVARDFAGIRGAVRLADGSVAVADGASGEVRRFAADGTHLGSFAGRGDGDGKVRQLGRLLARGDTLVVWDDARRAAMGFLPDGTFLGATPVEGVDAGQPLRFIGLLPDARAVLARARLDLPMRFSGEMVRVPVELLTWHRGAPAALAQLAGDEVVLQRGGGRTGVALRPFGLAARVVVRDSVVVVGDGAAHRFIAYGGDGAVRMVFGRAGARLPVLAADTAREHAQRLGAARSMRERESVDAIWRTSPPPDSLPAHGEMVADRGGALWIRVTAHVGDPASRWDVYAADGPWLGTVALPDRTTPLDIGPDWIVLRRVDADGVEHVALHRLRR